MSYCVTRAAKSFEVVLVERDRRVVYVRRRERLYVMDDNARRSAPHTQAGVALEDIRASAPPCRRLVERACKCPHCYRLHVCKENAPHAAALISECSLCARRTAARLTSLYGYMVTRGHCKFPYTLFSVRYITCNNAIRTRARRRRSRVRRSARRPCCAYHRRWS